LEVTPNIVLYGKKSVGKSHTKLFGQVWGLRAKILRTPTNLAASSLMSRDWAKICLQGRAKSGKIVFSPLETKKTTFSAKNLMGLMGPPLRHPYP